MAIKALYSIRDTWMDSDGYHVTARADLVDNSNGDVFPLVFASYTAAREQFRTALAAAATTLFGQSIASTEIATFGEWLSVNAGFRRVVVAATELDPTTDQTLSVDTSAVGSLVNIDLPDASLIAQGTPFFVKNEDGDFDVTMTPFGNQQIDEVPGVFSLASIAALPAKVCVMLKADQVVQQAPTTPAPPAPFGGAVHAVPGTFATVALAIAAAAPGDVIEVAAGSTITEAGTVTIDKSLEIRGVNRATSVVEGPAALTAALLQVAAGVTNVYIHTLTVRNNQSPVADGGGQSSCITVPTQRAATPDGSVGIYIDDCTFTHPKIGVSIDADGWVIRNCSFACNTATPGTTIRVVSNYGTANNCFIDGCTFTCTTDNRTQMVNIYGVGPRDVSFNTGQSGALVIRDCVQVGTARGYIEQNYWKQPGDALDPVTAGGFSVYIEDCTFGAYSSFSFSMFNTVGAGIDPLDFYDTLWLSNNTTGARTAGDQKGFVGFDGDGGPGRDIGTPAGGLYTPIANTIGSVPSGNYSNASTVASLLAVNTTIFAIPAPLLAPSAATAGAWRLGPSYG